MKKVIVMLFCVFCFLILFGCESYNKEYVVEELNGEIIKGKDAMDDFYQKTKQGEKIKLNYICRYFDDGKEIEETFYIKYDGNKYITNYQLFENSFGKSTYKYLIYSEEKRSGDTNIEKTEYYCLANNEEYTYQVVRNSWFSAVMEEHIQDAAPFYCYTYYKDGFKLGNYTSYKSLDYLGGFPTITFQNSNEYSLFYSQTSSIIDFGTYKISNGYIYLIKKIVSTNEKDQEIKLAFKIEKDKLIFDLKQSNVDGWKFEDGTTFYYNDIYK